MSTTTSRSTLLRHVADLVDEHPALPVPTVHEAMVSWRLYEWEHDRPLREVAADIRRTIGGTWAKSSSDHSFNLTTKVDDVDYVIFVEREQVCTRRVVGTETVTIPAVEAQPERTEEREVVEWDCAPVLATERVSA